MSTNLQIKKFEIDVLYIPLRLDAPLTCCHLLTPVLTHCSLVTFLFKLSTVLVGRLKREHVHHRALMLCLSQQALVRLGVTG